MIDQQELIGKVAARNSIRLEPGDPAFALVTLNEAVLQDAVKTATEEIRQVLNTFSESLAKTEHRAGRTLAQDVRVAAADSGAVVNGRVLIQSRCDLARVHLNPFSRNLFRITPRSLTGG
jgi:hypothetical protein